MLVLIIILITGTLKRYMKGTCLCNDLQEAEFKLKKQQQAGKKSKKGDTKSPSKTSKHPSKQPDTHASNKTKLNASHKQQPMQHVTSNKESVVPYQRKRPLQFNRKEAEVDGRVCGCVCGYVCICLWMWVFVCVFVNG